VFCFEVERGNSVKIQTLELLVKFLDSTTEGLRFRTRNQNQNPEILEILS
jgi:hypothetical protein